MLDDCSFVSIFRSKGKAKIALKRGKNPQKMEKKNRRPTCYNDINIVMSTIILQGKVTASLLSVIYLFLLANVNC